MTRAERIYYLIFALYCGSWSFLTAVYPLFLLSRGLDLFQINVVLAVYLLGAFVCEVPTGAVADLAGRKLSFLLSCLVRAVAFAMYWWAGGFAGCLAAEFVDAIGTTLATGALDAWAVDAMRDQGDLRPADRIFARAQLLAAPVMIASGLVGAYIADIDIALPWPCGAAGFAVTGAVGLFVMRESRRPHARAGLLDAWLRTTRAGFAAARRAPTVLVLCLLTGATAFAVMPAWHYWPARLQQLSGQGTWLLGWVWALASLAAMAGNALMPRLVPHFGRERVLAVASLWRGGMLGMAALCTGFAPALAAVIAMQLVWGLSEPTLQGWMNEHVDSDLRATVLSVRAMAFTLGGGLGLLCIGLFARRGGIPLAWGLSALLLVLVAPGFLLLARERHRAAPLHADGVTRQQSASS